MISPKTSTTTYKPLVHQLLKYPKYQLLILIISSIKPETMLKLMMHVFSTNSIIWTTWKFTTRLRVLKYISKWDVGLMLLCVRLALGVLWLGFLSISNRPLILEPRLYWLILKDLGFMPKSNMEHYSQYSKKKVTD